MSAISDDDLRPVLEDIARRGDDAGGQLARRVTTTIHRAWAPSEDDAIRERYADDGAFPLALLFGRTVPAVRVRAKRLGVARQRRWNDLERQKLQNLWGELGLSAIAKKLERTPQAAYYEAKRLGLPVGLPEGREYVRAAAARAGFAVNHLERILAWAGVRPAFTMSRPRRSSRHHRCVDPFDVDEAVRAWLATETFEAAARARGTTTWRLRAALSAAGVTRTEKGKKHWRVPTEVIDRALGPAQIAA